MKTGEDLKRRGLIVADKGWVLLRDGRRFEDRVYATEEAARQTARCFFGVVIAPAKRVWSFPRKRADWIIGEPI